MRHSRSLLRLTPLFRLVCGGLLVLGGCYQGGYGSRNSDGTYETSSRTDREGESVVGRRDGQYDANSRTAASSDRYGERARTEDRSRSEDRSRAEPGTIRQSLAFPTGDRRSSAILLEAQAPEEVRVGQPYTYTLRITNLTDTPLHNVRVRDLGRSGDTGDAMEDVGPRDRKTDADRIEDSARPAAAGQAAAETRTAADAKAIGEVKAGAEVKPGADVKAPAVPPARGGGAAWNVGTLAPRETKTHEFSATADEVGNLANCLTVAYSPTLCMSVRVVKPELKITKVAPERALLCENITYTYRVSNTGTGTARGVKVEEMLPEGLVTADGERRNVSIDVGDLGAGQSREVTARLRATRTGEYAGRAIARAATELEARSPDTTTVVKEPVLAVQVEAPHARYVGEAVDFKITVKNTGDADARNVILKLDAPGAAERVTDRDVGAIEAGKSKTVTVSTRAGRQAGNLQLTATASATCAKQASNSASVTIATAPALQLEAVDGTDPIRVGGTTTYTITVKNEGTGPDTNVLVRATLPPEMQYVATNQKNATDVKVEGQNLTFGPVKTLAPGATAAWTIEAKALQPGDVRFSLELTSDSLTKPAVETEPTRIVGDDNK
jgi:uncharacterized repeat protein (TIGR01451 family)